MSDAVGEVLREHTEARADLERDVAGLEFCEAADHAEDVRIGEEVLSKRLLRDDAHGDEGRNRVGLDLGGQPVGSTARTPQARDVWTTNAGSFRRPRTGCGARKGLVGLGQKALCRERGGRRRAAPTPWGT